MNENIDRKIGMTIEKLINGLFFWIGFIGTGVLIISEIVLIVVMVLGFDNNLSFENTIIISSLLALFALAVSWLMVIQGIKFGEDLERNKVVLSLYNNKVVDSPKVMKSYGMGHFWTKTVMMDVLIKGIVLGGSVGGMLTFFVSGNGDWGLMGIAANSMLLSLTLGMLSLNKGYKYYNEVYVLHIRRKIKQMEIDEVEKKKNDELRLKELQLDRMKKFIYDELTSVSVVEVDNE